MGDELSALTRRAGIAAKSSAFRLEFTRRGGPSAFDSRLRWLLAAFVVLSLTVYSRLIALELRDGAEYRAVAAEPMLRKHSVAGIRGRILARDGTALAYDQPVVALAVQYRWLEEPANPRWLRATARSRLSVAERKDRQRLAAEERHVLAQRAELWSQLAALCGLDDSQWRHRAERIQRRVEAIATGVNARHDSKHSAARQADDEQDLSGAGVAGVFSLLGRSVVEALFALDDAPTASNMTIAEELTEHVMFEGLSLEAVAEIETYPERYPGVKLVHSYRRCYPNGELAAHLLGYVGAANDTDKNDDDAHDHEDWIGRAGVERQYEQLLGSRRGLMVDRVDVRGKASSSTTVREPADGKDVALTIDSALQRTAQALLDQAVARRLPAPGQHEAAGGGAALVIDVRNGAILAAASAPRFDPNGFVQTDNASIRRWLADANRPLFDRTVQMALPPGSVFKIASAAAILETGLNPLAPVECQGYLHQTQTLRCAVFRRFGIGHGPVTLADALARSCNVYFFHHAEQIGPAPLVAWGRRFGLGQTTGFDLPGEVSGALPPVDVADAKSKENRQDPRLISIGQGPVTATPLQIAQMIAAIANGGNLVTPHVTEHAAKPARQISGLTPEMLSAIRKGLRQAVADEQGTAHATVELDHITIAGKTGTAEVGGNQPDHAWFAGYAPADEPRLAFVVVIEHAGNAATAAGPVVQHLVQRMNDLGFFDKGSTAGTGGNARRRLLQ